MNELYRHSASLPHLYYLDICTDSLFLKTFIVCFHIKSDRNNSDKSPFSRTS